MNNPHRYAALAVLMLPLSAQQAPPQKDSGITHEQADAILNELRQIRQLLEKQGGPSANNRPAEPPRAKLDLAGMQMLGSKDAPLTMVEFTDYQCPFCQRFHTTVFSDIKKNYIDTGKVRFYSRDLPLDSMHPNAIRAAMAARCAADQGQFWAIRDIMGAHPDKLDMASIMEDASSLHMNTDTFKSCVESEKYKSAIQTDVLEAMKIGADGTPTFVIGKSTPTGVDGEVLVGAQPFVAFDQKLKQLEAAK
jgi:protein-disulfide isomerase